MELINVDGLKKQKSYLESKNIPFKYVECDKDQCPSEVNGYPHNVLPGGKIIEGYYDGTN